MSSVYNSHHYDPPYRDLPDVFHRVYYETWDLCATDRRARAGIAQSDPVMFHNMRVVEHLCRNNIDGVFIECGVFRGATPAMMIKTIKYLGYPPRDIWVYDTFAGAGNPKDGYFDMDGGPMEDVKRRLDTLDYPYVRYVEGRVEETLARPENRPHKIAFLRLDTDYYTSTAAELKWLGPLVVSGGIIVVDDYGAYAECARAVDEYTGGRIFLHRIDEHVRTWTKA